MTGHLSGLIVKANTGEEKNTATQVWWLVRAGHILGYWVMLRSNGEQTQLAPLPSRRRGSWLILHTEM